MGLGYLIIINPFGFGLPWLLPVFNLYWKALRGNFLLNKKGVRKVLFS